MTTDVRADLLAQRRQLALALAEGDTSANAALAVVEGQLADVDRDQERAQLAREERARQQQLAREAEAQAARKQALDQLAEQREQYRAFVTAATIQLGETLATTGEAFRIACAMDRLEMVSRPPGQPPPATATSQDAAGELGGLLGRAAYEAQYGRFGGTP
jgi:hypothetical protein